MRKLWLGGLLALLGAVLFSMSAMLHGLDDSHDNTTCFLLMQEMREIEAFRVRHQRLPTGLAELPGDGQDGHRQPWVYRVTGAASYELRSMGANGVDEAGLGDDVWREGIHGRCHRPCIGLCFDQWAPRMLGEG